MSLLNCTDIFPESPYNGFFSQQPFASWQFEPIAAAICMGALTSLTAIVIVILCQQGFRDSKTNIGMLTIVATMYLSSLLHNGTTIYHNVIVPTRILMNAVTHRRWLKEPAIVLDPLILGKVQGGAILVNVILSDAVVIWRVWLIWGRSRGILVLSSLLSRRNMFKQLHNEGFRGSSVGRALALLLESGVAYSLFWALFMAATISFMFRFTGSLSSTLDSADFILADIVVYAAAIYLNFVLLVAALQRRAWNEAPNGIEGRLPDDPASDVCITKSFAELIEELSSDDHRAVEF
ncbi:hypothetical protein BC834DRAFT_967361 [Gloeopeniophorella convolvens]|nr:hypothetical protein BC834DRAFT_967361 [Gloeopeniophorella convolvens]